MSEDRRVVKNLIGCHVHISGLLARTILEWRGSLFTARMPRLLLRMMHAVDTSVEGTLLRIKLNDRFWKYFGPRSRASQVSRPLSDKASPLLMKQDLLEHIK